MMVVEAKDDDDKKTEKGRAYSCGVVADNRATPWDPTHCQGM